MKLTEKDEEETIKREIEKRRTRLGAGRPEQIKNEVNCEVRERSTVRVTVSYSLLCCFR